MGSRSRRLPGRRWAEGGVGGRRPGGATPWVRPPSPVFLRDPYNPSPLRCAFLLFNRCTLPSMNSESHVRASRHAILSTGLARLACRARGGWDSVRTGHSNGSEGRSRGPPGAPKGSIRPPWQARSCIRVSPGEGPTGPSPDPLAPRSYFLRALKVLVTTTTVTSSAIEMARMMPDTAPGSIPPPPTVSPEGAL